ncbi:thioredoxin domain-containing protein [Rhizobium sp. BE258]|uniref:thioredoxin domain-containing protein n=1 Tax=Rhizobium sp. BE258 TaxID=2817722 RepID=UPI0028568528|nr:thioredoxin domain-containing protein [Rhizobium sp. BE258]MDR7147794.1 hypothetical protein [Rhizobium sp. BE258]
MNLISITTTAVRLCKFPTACPLLKLLHGAAFAALLADQAADSKPLNTVDGQAPAPVTLTVYSSRTCSHCLEFERNYLPALRKDYVESRKLQIPHKPFLRNSVDAVIFMLAKGEGGVDETVKRFIVWMDDLAAATDLQFKLREIASDLNITEAQFDRTVADHRLLMN